MNIFGQVTFDAGELVINNSPETVMKFIKEADAAMQDFEFTQELAVYLIRELKKELVDDAEKEEFQRFFCKLVEK